MTELSSETIAIVKSTAGAMQVHGVAITTRMYERLFVDPAVKAMFDQAAQTSGEQPRRLAGAILAFSQNVDRLSVLAPAIHKMTKRHAECGVQAAHYPIVAGALLPAIKDVLGDAIDEKTLGAWGEAYWFLANLLIAEEAQIYAEAA